MIKSRIQPELKFKGYGGRQKGSLHIHLLTSTDVTIEDKEVLK